ncbi:MAG: efflux RND transporter periplasmic adaptor subunit [Thermoguttaceae bacterium]|jgi:HlyD family secretion protein
MKQFLFWSIVLAGLAAAGAAGYQRYNASRSASGQYRTKAVRRGDVNLVVNSTGTVQPVLSVQVGAFVSGPIKKVCVDFNDKVKKDQILAQIDPRTYVSAEAHEKAALAHADADLTRVQALLEQSRRVERRNTRLKEKKAISDNDYEQSVTDRKSLEAQVDLCKATILQCKADLETAGTNLDFTEIKSPVDGIVIDRKVDPGQTMAAQFQTPVMFIVAPDLEKKVYVYASVDEADIGLIREAQKRRQPVTFSVDAYPDDTFTGHVFQVRLNPTTVANVVTYTVVVEAANGDLKLLPGMTANLTFQIEQQRNVLSVPNAALRFHPKPEQVRKSDLAIVEGRAEEENASGGSTELGEKRDSAASHVRKPAHVWIVEGSQLAAVEVVTGLAGKGTTEVISGDLSEGQEVVTSLQSTATNSNSSSR